MELVELLDKIDETAPKTCETCLYMATHEKCNGCLTLPGDYKTEPRPDFRYLNWKPGNWLRRVQAQEHDGTRNIVIGGQGEAEVNTKWTPARTSKHLHYVAEQCGYYCGGLCIPKNDKDKGIRLDIITHEGAFRLYWDTADTKQGGKLHRIDRLNSDGEVVRQSWPNF